MNMPINRAAVSTAFRPSEKEASKEPAAVTINYQGFICCCNAAAEMLFGRYCSELRQHHISLLLPSLEGVDWVEKGQPNHRLSFLSHIGHGFDALDKWGNRFSVKLFINDLKNANDATLRLVFRPSRMKAGGVAA